MRWSLVLLLLTVVPAAADFVTFESGHVRPLAQSPDGTRLFAVNTPDDRLEILAVDDDGLTHAGSVPVGLEPVAVAARTDGEVWVVNHLSDSISIVDVAAMPPRVVRTLLVGDEPRDIVFAGPGRTRAFVTTAHRGQNSPVDPALSTPGVGRADVWVFDAQNLGTGLGGTPLTILTLFGDTPRALAVSPDGGTVYAAVFHSGNQTTPLSEGVVCNGGAAAPPCQVGGFTMPGGLPAPNTNVQGVPQREVGLIVKWDEGASAWRDELGRNWNDAVRFSLPDEDVFAIDAGATPPVQTAAFAHVGTVLFDMIANPVTGKIYVTNTDARNEVRFEGPGTFFGSTTVQGRLHQARITVLDGATVLPRHLNKHLDYDVRPAPPSAKSASLATPIGMAVNAAGTTLYVAAFGSSRIGVFDTAALENDTFTPDAATHIPVSGGGPSGLVLDEARDRLYVMTRFDDAVKVIRVSTRVEESSVALHDPEPASVRDGRPVLYDAILSSSNGEASCAACHVFGDFDSLSWDLGNPDDVVLNNPNPIRLGGIDPAFHPLKGPMTTQSLRGVANHGPMHWRGDRTGGNDPGGSALSEEQAFAKFDVAFEGLLGKAEPIDADAMARFGAFILQVTYPPNPIKRLDDVHSSAAELGRTRFFGSTSDIIFNCNGCHMASGGGFFGTDGQTTFENEPQMFKVPHLRNLYQKVGMFGMPTISFLRPGDNDSTGPQVRGVGFLHDGSVDTLFRFHQATVFSLSTVEARQIEQFMFEFDANLKPAVGQQITLDDGNAATVGPRVDLLLGRDFTGDCQVVVKGTIDGEQRGFLRLAAGTFQSDRAAEPAHSDAAVRALAGVAGQALTYTCVPPGEGTRIGVDRDGDGYFDRDELDAGSDPANAASIPDGTPPTPTPDVALIPSTRLELRDRRRQIRFVSRTAIVPPTRGSEADPSLRGGSLQIYNSAGRTTDSITVTLRSDGWKLLGPATKPRGYRYVDSLLHVIMKADRIVVKDRFGPTYRLDDPRQDRIAVRLVMGGSQTWCADTGAKGKGSPPNTARTDRRGRFSGAPNTPAPATCPKEPPPGSPSGAFLD
ncbi:MAG TPA: hypothetical protein VGR62_17520 [Candidatus Binatia bacterium]|jgi:DNA-binding beta-propeller fold protein YncE|nr:hypothetical protein [Candidatus Binatia bacterium]